MTRRDAADLTSVEALGVAIRSEMDSRDSSGLFRVNMAQRTWVSGLSRVVNSSWTTTLLSL